MRLKTECAATKELFSLFTVRIHVDAKEIRNCVLADDEIGVVHALKMNDDGSPMINRKRDGIVVEILTGFVEIKFFIGDLDVTDKLMVGL